MRTKTLFFTRLDKFWLQGWNVKKIDIPARDGTSLGAPHSGLECQDPSGYWLTAHCSLVSRESGGKLGLLMISRFNWACLFYALVCAGFWGEVFNVYAHDIPNVSIPVRRQLIGTTWILFDWRSCSIASRAFQCGCPGVPWWQLTIRVLTHLTFLEFTLVADLMAVPKDDISGQLVHRWMSRGKSIVDS